MYDDLDRQHILPRDPQQKPWKTSPSEIYASGGGLHVAPLNTPHLLLSL